LNIKPWWGFSTQQKWTTQEIWLAKNGKTNHIVFV
jgi:hypothetical protein